MSCEATVSILDARTFHLDDPNAKKLYDGLWGLFGKSGPVKGFVDAAGLKEGWVNWDQPMAEAWRDVLQYAAREGKLRRLTEVIVENPNSVPVRALIASLAHGPVVATADPFGVSMLAAWRPMFDREPLRERLRELAADEGWRVFVVNGPKASGKSHSWFLMSHLCERIGGFDCARVDLASWSGPPMGPVEVMQLVTPELGWAPPAVDTTAQEETQLRVLLAWFKREAKALPRPFWLVVDAVDGPTVGATGRALVVALANAAGNAEAGGLRVVLLGFDGTLADTVDAFAPRETLVYLTDGDLRKFFADVATQHGYQVDDAAALDRLVAQALGELEAFDPLRLGEIAARAGPLAAGVFPPRERANG
jgi:hypothetical protein